ncbi:MAG: ketopantoate reductase family protein [Clostridia bacterium]|nr:ketopantoate reductase family protein [Clostridia bacterium]
MKLLVYGAGVIGTTYAWKLDEAGHDVTIFVRKEMKKHIEENGFILEYLDTADKKKERVRKAYFPKVTDALSPDDGYELIIAAVKYNQLSGILPDLAENAGEANILFFQNNWSEFDMIEKYVKPENYLLGFPAMVGGGREGNKINCIIFRESYSSTMLGEKDGKRTPRLSRVYKVMKSAGMKPEISDCPVDWLATHYIMQASGIGAFLKAGSYSSFAASRQLIRESIMAHREGLNVCKVRGFDPKKIFMSRMYYFPMFLILPVLSMFYKSETTRMMVEGHMAKGMDEMIDGFYRVLGDGERLGINMPYWEQFKRYVDEYYQRILQTGTSC